MSSLTWGVCSTSYVGTGRETWNAGIRHVYIILGIQDARKTQGKCTEELFHHYRLQCAFAANKERNEVYGRVSWANDMCEQMEQK